MGVNKVDLSTGETLIDLTSDSVTPSTLAEGETAHNAAGEEITGNVRKLTNLTWTGKTPSATSIGVKLTQVNQTDVMLPKSSEISMIAPFKEFGTALPSDVMTGTKFTSVEGLNVDGTFTLDSEMVQQNSLIEQIKTALQSKSAPIVYTGRITGTLPVGTMMGYTAFNQGFTYIGSWIEETTVDIKVPHGTVIIFQSVPENVTYRLYGLYTRLAWKHENYPSSSAFIVEGDCEIDIT